MTLFEQLDALNPNEDVFIGSKSAFFFIGKPEEFENAVYDLDKQWYANFKTRIKSAQNKIASHKATKPKEDMKPVVKKMWDADAGKNAEVELKYEYFYTLWHKKLEEYQRQVAHAKEMFVRFKPFSGREVKEVYRNIADDATIVIVEGDEAARFWFKSEYERFKLTGKVFDDSDIEEYDKEFEDEDESENNDYEC